MGSGGEDICVVKAKVIINITFSKPKILALNIIKQFGYGGGGEGVIEKPHLDVVQTDIKIEKTFFVACLFFFL